MTEKTKSCIGWIMLFILGTIGFGWIIIERNALAVCQTVSFLFAITLFIAALLTSFSWLFVLSGLFATANIISTISFLAYVIYKQNSEE